MCYDNACAYPMMEVPITKGETIIVDDDDYKRVSEHQWYVLGGYAVSKIKGKLQYLHRFITRASKAFQVRHLNMNVFDNRKENLHVFRTYDPKLFGGKHCDNKTGYRGVSMDGDKFHEQIYCLGKKIHLGNYDTAKDAYTAYCNAAIDLHGKSAKLD